MAARSAVRHAQADADLHAAVDTNLPAVYINGGARGFLVRVSPHDVVRVLSPTLVDVAV